MQPPFSSSSHLLWVSAKQAAACREPGTPLPTPSDALNFCRYDLSLSVFVRLSPFCDVGRWNKQDATGGLDYCGWSNEVGDWSTFLSLIWIGLKGESLWMSWQQTKLSFLATRCSASEYRIYVIGWWDSQRDVGMHLYNNDILDYIFGCGKAQWEILLEDREEMYWWNGLRPLDVQNPGLINTYCCTYLFGYYYYVYYATSSPNIYNILYYMSVSSMNTTTGENIFFIKKKPYPW